MVTVVAVDPRAFADQPGAEDKSFWSDQPVQAPAIPSVDQANWCHNPIDRFVLARLEAAGLKPAGRASRSTLLRRLHYTLTRAPPRAWEAGP